MPSRLFKYRWASLASKEGALPKKAKKYFSLKSDCQSIHFITTVIMIYFEYNLAITSQLNHFLHSLTLEPNGCPFRNSFCLVITLLHHFMDGVGRELLPFFLFFPLAEVKVFSQGQNKHACVCVRCKAGLVLLPSTESIEGTKYFTNFKIHESNTMKTFGPGVTLLLFSWGNRSPLAA